MRVDRTIHLMFALLLTLAAVGGSAPLRGAASSIDQSDLWWNPDESGWGIQYAHTGNAIFATMYVHGPTNQPTWYVATLEPQPSSDTWSGPLFATSGPWFGTVPFDSALVRERTAGTMAWSALSAESGVLMRIPLTAWLLERPSIGSHFGRTPLQANSPGSSR